MLECSEGVAAVGVLDAMAAVVEAENVAGGVFEDGTMIGAGGVIGDRSDAMDEPGVGGGVPVAGEERPGDDLQVEGAGGGG